MAKLMLDALFPPAPGQLVADLSAVGADGCMVYVWRPGGVGSWAPAHVDALRSAGKLAAPIIVPPPSGGDIGAMLDAAQAFGFRAGSPITLDLEPPNLPPAAWEEQFDQAARARGFSDFDYGTTSNLGAYQPDDDNWVASWLRTGQLQPLPEAPAHGGWQFVNDLTVNGSQYDASVVADVIFGGAPTFQPTPVDPTGTWWAPYVSTGGQFADQVVLLPGFCHAPVLAASGHWYRASSPIATPVLGEFCEWALANHIAGQWFDMDESGGPQGQGPVGRLAPDQAYWIDDASVDTTGCGGSAPPQVAQTRGGQWLAVRWPAPVPPTPPAPPPPPPPPPPAPPDVPGAVAAVHSAQAALDQALKALEP